jgi:hypothetical protein
MSKEQRPPGSDEIDKLVSILVCEIGTTGFLYKYRSASYRLKCPYGRIDTSGKDLIGSPK